MADGTISYEMAGHRGLSGTIVATALVVASCGSAASTPDALDPFAPTSTGRLDDSASETQPDETVASSSDAGDTNPTGQGCSPDSAGGVPFATTVTSAATTLLERDDGLRVEAVVYPHPDYAGRPWSQWGQGITLADGRHLSAIGDHQPRDGNSFIYEFDPTTSTLTQVGDILSMVDHQEGAWAYGKVHGQMIEGACGEVYFSSYWGSRRNIEFTDGYAGDILFEIDPVGRTIAPHDVILENHGVPSLAGTTAHGLLYAEALDPLIQDSNQGSFVVLDPETDTVVFEDDRTDHTGFRSIAVDSSGRAYYSIGNGMLAVYDPATNEATELGSDLPGDFLRAATAPGPDGTIYGVTRRPDEFFSLSPDGTVTNLSSARGYTTSMALTPDGGTFYYVPDAHGGAWQSGTPVIAVDTATGEDSVLVELDDLAVEAFGMHLGGTYNISLDPRGELLYIGMNAGDPQDDAFGEVVLVVVTLP